MSIAAILVAAGRGLRAGGGQPKQWRLLHGAPVLAHSLRLFTERTDIQHVVVVVHPDDAAQIQALNLDKIIITTGGATRAESVKRGLDTLRDAAPRLVLIHDAARPLTPQHVIDGVIVALATAEGAAPALPVTDSLWRGNNGEVAGTVSREGLYRAQTPQGFHFTAICQAHAQNDGSASDDVEVARAAGLRVAITAGDERNLKITHPEDFARAKRLMTRNIMDIRTGNGFDVHRFCEGDHVWLCGIKIPHAQGLDGHSDADVGMHALTDAIYGALAEGDIGQHFPPSDMQWKGAASDIFLRHAVALAGQKGFAITHLDCTLICEFPKVGPHAMAMRLRLAEITGLEIDRISVKATTSERLGFTGRGEGIASIATATLVKS